MTLPVSAKQVKLLEQYFAAKDGVKPEIISATYLPDAALTISLVTTNIEFPAKVIGRAAIEKTLVIDFAKVYNRCKSYYVCDVAPAGDDASTPIIGLPWLVLMRDEAAASLRIGKGWYDWHFAESEAGLRVSDMHIHIERMDVIADHDAQLLQALQGALSYPWLSPATLLGEFEKLALKDARFEFLHQFKTPQGV